MVINIQGFSPIPIQGSSIYNFLLEKILLTIGISISFFFNSGIIYFAINVYLDN